MKIEGNLIDLHLREIYPASISIVRGKITEISRLNKKLGTFILPGFIDSHVHIESSMVTPGAFASVAVRHGTIGTVSDPHEIANILGVKGIEYMIRDGKKVPFYFWFGAPSCVPATSFETTGSVIGPEETDMLLERIEIKYLSEMMNFPGVINSDTVVFKKINSAKAKGKVIDGHAPGLRGTDLKIYLRAGISTDHECSTVEEAIEKIGLGMKILIREGSAARNLDALKTLMNTYPEMIMLCSDDIHPEMLLKGHINILAAKLIKEKYDIFNVLRSCSVNPVMHYGLEAGLLRVGDSADFIVTTDPDIMEVMETWIGGVKVFDGRNSLFNYKKGSPINLFNCSKVTQKSIAVKKDGDTVNVIQAHDGELLTDKIIMAAGKDPIVTSDVSIDMLKIVVKDRYSDAPPAVGFIKGFGLRYGAFAGSVAHDSHNIICVGVDDKDITAAINCVVKMKGGLAVCSPEGNTTLKLRIGGIMSDNSCEEVAEQYENISKKVREMGCRMGVPFMTLSFMALLVIPSLKMSDQGLFDVDRFCFTSLFNK